MEMSYGIIGKEINRIRSENLFGRTYYSHNSGLVLGDLVVHMSIKVNLDLLLVKRKMKLQDLSKNVGITMANLSILKQNKARAIRFSTLDALCRELSCQPGDILEYENESD